MQKIINFIKLAKNCITILASLILVWVKDNLGSNMTHWFSNAPAEYNLFILLIFFPIFFVILIVALYLIEDRLRNLVDKSRWLRHRLMGKDDIEGTWIDAVYTENLQHWSGGILRIRYREDNYIVDGVTYDDQGIRIGDFSSTVVHYEAMVLRFWYKKTVDRSGIGKHEGAREFEGSARYKFGSKDHGTNSHTNKFSGYYIWFEGDDRHIIGERVEEQEAVHLSEENEGEMIKKFIAKKRKIIGS